MEESILAQRRFKEASRDDRNSTTYFLRAYYCGAILLIVFPVLYGCENKVFLNNTYSEKGILLVEVT